VSAAWRVLLSLTGMAALCSGLVAASGAAWSSPNAIGAPEAPPLVTIARDAHSLVIAGDASSDGHREIMTQVAAATVPDLAADIDLSLGKPLPPGWSLVSEMALRAVGATYAANATVAEQGVTVDGFVTDRAAWAAAEARLRASLLPGMELRVSVTELDPNTSFDDQCLGLMRAAVRRRRVEFSQSGDALNSNAFGLLDELVEIAVDCPAVQIAVTGHTDGSGDAAFNQALSQARADAVVAYMVGKGIARERFRSAGAGSTSPVVAEVNAHARSQNRRIEFEFFLAGEADGR